MRQFLFIALAIATFSGCTKQVDEPQLRQKRGDGAIRFTTAVPTKGASITTETITNFSVFGYKTGDNLWNDVASTALPDLFKDKTITRYGSGAVDDPYTWDYEGGDVNWGEGFLLNFTFFGYSPLATADNGITAPADGVPNIPIVAFSTPTDVTKQVDLLTAEVRDRKATVGPVQMRFKHALSRIGFKAFSLTPSVKVTKIEIVGVEYKGNLTLDGSWDSAGDTGNFTLAYSTPAVVPLGVESSAADISSSDGYFLLLPQDPSIGGSSKIIFHCTVGDKEVPQKEYVIQENWEKGKTITYTVDLTAHMEADLEVTGVEITDWQTGKGESGDGDGKVNEVTLSYNDGGMILEEKVMQNEEILISKRPTSPIGTWNTKSDGSGDYYGVGDAIPMIKNMTLYSVDNTVTIGGMRWLRGNMSGTESTAEGYYAESNPAKPGMFFKWGDQWVYQHASSTTDGLITQNGSTSPGTSSTGSLGYDYVGLGGGKDSGDPCAKLGEGFMTPTRAQFETLRGLGKSVGTYRGVKGYFFGTDAATCTDKTIAPECIFFPTRGFRSSSSGTLQGDGVQGAYWSASTIPNHGYYLELYSVTNYEYVNINYVVRKEGLSVRCVSTDVKIGGVNWTTTNLEGKAGTATEHRMAKAPQDYGNFFKWGSTFVYQRESSTSDGGGWGKYTNGAATSPSATNTSGVGYDYAQGLGGVTNSGDPCLKLGAGYRTPTSAQWVALNSSGIWGNYNNIPGRFFGPNAGDCKNETLKDGCIFIPASGYRYYMNGTQDSQGSEGRYWSSSVDTNDRGHYCYFNIREVAPESSNYRGTGYSVRCVRDATIK